MSNYLEIQSLLNEQLSLTTGLPSLWNKENGYLEPNDDDIHIESRLIPAPSDNPIIGLDAPTYESGIFQILISTPRGTSWGDAYSLVDTFVEQFKRNTVLTSSSAGIIVKIKKAYPKPGFNGSDGKYKVPVHIEYFAYIDL